MEPLVIYAGMKLAKLPLRDIWSPGMLFIRDLQEKCIIGDPKDSVIYTTLHRGHYLDTSFDARNMTYAVGWRNKLRRISK